MPDLWSCVGRWMTWALVRTVLVDVKQQWRRNKYHRSWAVWKRWPRFLVANNAPGLCGRKATLKKRHLPPNVYSICSRHHIADTEGEGKPHLPPNVYSHHHIANYWRRRKTASSTELSVSVTIALSTTGRKWKYDDGTPSQTWLLMLPELPVLPLSHALPMNGPQ